MFRRVKQSMHITYLGSHLTSLPRTANTRRISNRPQPQHHFSTQVLSCHGECYQPNHGLTVTLMLRQAGTYM